MNILHKRINRSLNETPVIPVHTDQLVTRTVSKTSHINAQDRSLAQVSPNAMNALNGYTAPPVEQPHIKQQNSRSNSTIRSVPTERVSLDPGSQEGSWASQRSQPRSGSPAMPHYTSANNIPPVPALPTSTSYPALSRQTSNSIGLSPVNGVVRRISSEFGPTRSLSTPNGLNIPADDHSTDTNGNGTNGTVNGHIISPSTSNGQQWSTAVGRPTLGKSGRVIEKLQNQLDTMKRELTSERLNTAEYKNAVNLAETKMGQMREEHDLALHDAAITKTTLKRRERQLAEYKGDIETEKVRADKAVEREKGWREQMEKVEQESKRKVEEAQMHAALMDGRVKAMTSHWKDQGAEVNRTVRKMEREIKHIVEERRGDDERMNMLQGLCDQQAEQLASLQREKDAIERKFEEYKAEQERQLANIKAMAARQEREGDEKLKEATEVLGQLKWALGVKKNVRDAR